MYKKQKIYSIGKSIIVEASILKEGFWSTYYEIQNYMKNLFVPYELALKLKEKGFDEPCFGYYYADVDFELRASKPKDAINWNIDEEFHNDVSAPLWQQVIDWILSKGFIVRIRENGVGYEMRGIEWEGGEYILVDNLQSGIEDALELI